jgi:hypothetical protein
MSVSAAFLRGQIERLYCSQIVAVVGCKYYLIIVARGVQLEAKDSVIRLDGGMSGLAVRS